jgi:hypothetical protein
VAALAGVPSGDFMRFQSFGSSSRGVYFIHPSIKKFIPSKPPPFRKKFRRNHVPVLEMSWIRNDHICGSGKPPSARRSFTVTTLLDGKTHVLFGGMGLDAGGGPLMDPVDMKNLANEQEIEPNLLHREQYFNETYLLSDLSNLLALTPANVVGLGMNSTHCKTRYTPVPPAYKPPMRPFMVRVIDTDAPNKAKNILVGKYMSVGDLKESIELVMNVSVGNRSLSFNGNLLVDDAIKLGYAEMGDGDMVYIVNVLTPPPPPPKDEEPEPPSPDDLLQAKGLDPSGHKKRKNEKAKSKAGGGLLASLMKPLVKGIMAALPKVPSPTMPEILPPRVPALPLSPPKVPSLPSIPKVPRAPPPPGAPNVPGAPPPPGAPNVPGAPPPPGAPPGAPPSPGTPNVPGAPPTPGTPNVPGAPPSSGAPVPTNPPSAPGTPGAVGASPAAGASKVPLTPQVASVNGREIAAGGAHMSPKEALLHANKGKEDTAGDMSPFIVARLGNDAVESPVSQPELHQVVKSNTKQVRRFEN